MGLRPERWRYIMEFDRIGHIAKKEFRQILRDRKMLFIIFVPPIVEMLIFGYAVSFDVDRVSTAILDQDKTSVSREFVERFSSSGYFSITRNLTSPDQIDPLVDDGTVKVCICIKKGFGRDLAAGRTADLLIIIDGTDSFNASVVLGYINSIVSSYSERILLERIDIVRRTGATTPISAARIGLMERTWFNEELKSQNYFISGMIASILSVVGMILSAMSIVKEREIGTMEQLTVTPVSTIELIVGKMIPFVAIAYINVSIVTAIAVFWFGVPFKGSLIFFLFAVLLFFVANLSLGLMISTVSATQQEAMMNTFLYIFPAILFSGYVFPIESMPRAIIPITYIIPDRYFIELLRGIFIKGMGPAELWPSLVGLILLTFICVVVSVVHFHKRIA